MSKDPNLDIFVGNLAFNTTEEMLREVFSVVGTVRGVRILMDKETMRPKGYAFIEFANTDSVNAAVRLLDKTELNGRLLRVSFASGTGTSGGIGHDHDSTTGRPMAGTIGAAVSNLQLHEVWDILDTMKKLNDEQRLRAILEAHPQLVAATAELQKRLGIV